MEVFGVREWAKMLDSYVGLMQLANILIAVGEGEKGTIR